MYLLLFRYFSGTVRVAVRGFGLNNNNNPNNPNNENNNNVAPQPPNSGIIAEINNLVIPFFLSLLPTWTPPEFQHPVNNNNNNNDNNNNENNNNNNNPNHAHHD